MTLIRPPVIRSEDPAMAIHCSETADTSRRGVVNDRHSNDGFTGGADDHATAERTSVRKRSKLVKEVLAAVLPAKGPIIRVIAPDSFRMSCVSRQAFDSITPVSRGWLDTNTASTKFGLGNSSMSQAE
jgi:hypothetical protein